MSQLMKVDAFLPIVLGALTLFSMIALGLSWFSLGRAKFLARAAAARSKAAEERLESAIGGLQAGVEALTTQVSEIKQQPLPLPVQAAPAAPRPGMNLTKRSHALRLHRRGDPADQIAAALDLPVREVDLLLKVHQIVISNI